MGYDVSWTACRRRDTPGILSRSSWILLTTILHCLLPVRVAALSWNRVPQNQMVSPGGTATFQCQVQDRGTNDVIWNRGMEILFRNAERNLNTPLRYAIEGEFNLVLRNVSLEDNQEFTCNVWNLGAKSARLILLLPPEPPTITRNVTSPLQEGTSLGLTCSTRGGNPAPTLRWLRNGQERIGGASSTEGNVTRSELPVLLTRTDNQANFSCVVGNEALGNSTLVTSTVLSVQYRPYVSFKPYTPLVLALGASATLSCDVDANPSVSAVAWQLNANGLPERTPTLQFGAARRDQAGNYTCTATNSVGTGSSTVSVSVFYAPILTVDQTVEGEEMTSLTLTCDVDAQPPVDQVTWRSVDTGLVVSASRQLSFPSLQRSQAGNYSCSAANAFALSGQAQQTYERVVFSQVFVLYKPGVASIRPVADVSVGERVDIKCSVTPEGYPRPTYEWRKGDVVLSQQSSTMTILSATLGDNALYTCTPSNSLGPGTPNQISLTVNELPSLQSPLLPASLTVGIGESAPQSLSCLARGRPTPTLTWHKDGDPQPLEVKFPDLYRVTSRNSTVDTYATLVTSTLDLAGAGRQGTTSLRVEDMGNYTCRVTSQSFSDVIVQTTEFYVQFQPQPQTQAVRVAVNLSQNAELPCRVRSFPAPSFRWQWRGEELPGAGPASSRYSVTSGPLPGSALYQGTLLVTNVQPSDLGVYTCTASNTLGQSDLAITLSLTSVPEMPTSLQAGQVTWESVELRWEGGFDGGLPQSFKVRELGGLLPSPLDVNPPSASSFNVTRLHPKTAYTFAVYGVNGLGQGKQSSELVVLTQALTLPSLGGGLQYKAGEGVLLMEEPADDAFCLRLLVRRASSQAWEATDPPCRPPAPRVVVGVQGVVALNASLCLQSRPDVCGPVSSVSIDQTGGSGGLTEQHVIIIAVVCGIIIITLLFVLVWFICRRKRNLQQHQKDGVDSPQRALPMNGTVATGKKSTVAVYDNQGMDLQHLSLSHRPPHPGTQQPDLCMPGYGGRDGHGRPDAGGQGGVQYLDLGEKRADGQGWPESGYSTPDPATTATKPKKVIYEVIV